MRSGSFAFAGLAMAFACSSGPQQGTEGGACYPNGTCNAGLSCLSNLCVNASVDGGPSDAAADASDGSADVVVADASDANATDASDGSTFDIHSLSGLLIWLDGAKGVTADGSNRVSAWADQSGLANDAVTQSSQKPLLVASGIGGQPTIHFDAPQSLEFMLVPSTTSSTIGTGDFLVEIVATAPTTTTGEVLFESTIVGTGDAFYTYRLSTAGTGVFTSYAQTTSTPTQFGGVTTNLTGSKAHLFALQRTGTTVELRVDGSTDASDTNAAYAQSFAGLGLYSGDFAEAVVVKGTVSSANRASLEGFLKSKYAL